MTVRKGETKVQSSITSQPATTYEMSENSWKLQQLSEIKACTSIIQPPTYDAKNKQGTRTLQGEIRSHVVEPQLHFAQAPLPNQMNTIPLYAVDTTVPPPVMTKCPVLKSLWGHWLSASKRPSLGCSRKGSRMIHAPCVSLVIQCPVTLVTPLVIGQPWWHSWEGLRYKRKRVATTWGR